MSERADKSGIARSFISPAHERHMGRGECGNDDHYVLQTKEATVASGQPPVTLACHVLYSQQTFLRLSVWLAPKNRKRFYVYFPADTTTVEYDHPDAQLFFGKIASESSTCLRFEPKKPGLLVGPPERDGWTLEDETSRRMLESLHRLTQCSAFTVRFPDLKTFSKTQRAPSATPREEVDNEIRSLYKGRGGLVAASTLLRVPDFESIPTGHQPQIATEKQPRGTASTKGARSGINTAGAESRSPLTLPSSTLRRTSSHVRPVKQPGIGSADPDAQLVSNECAVADSDESSLQDTQAFEHNPLQDTQAFEDNLRQDTLICEHNPLQDAQAFEDNLRQDTLICEHSPLQDILICEHNPLQDTQAFEDNHRQDTQAFRNSPLQDTLICEHNPLKDIQAFGRSPRQDTLAREDSTESLRPGTEVIESTFRVTIGRGPAPETADWTAPPPRPDVDRLAITVSKPSRHVGTNHVLSRAAFSEARCFSTRNPKEQKEFSQPAANGGFDELKYRAIINEEVGKALNKEMKDIRKWARQQAEKGMRQKIQEVLRQKAKRDRQRAGKSARQRVREAKELFRQKAQKRVRQKERVWQKIWEHEKVQQRLRQEIGEAEERSLSKIDNEIYNVRRDFRTEMDAHAADVDDNMRQDVGAIVEDYMENNNIDERIEGKLKGWKADTEEDLRRSVGEALRTAAASILEEE